MTATLLPPDEYGRRFYSEPGELRSALGVTPEGWGVVLVRWYLRGEEKDFVETWVDGVRFESQDAAETYAEICRESGL